MIEKKTNMQLLIDKINVMLQYFDQENAHNEKFWNDPICVDSGGVSPNDLVMILTVLKSQVEVELPFKNLDHVYARVKATPFTTQEQMYRRPRWYDIEASGERVRDYIIFLERRDEVTFEKEMVIRMQCLFDYLKYVTDKKDSETLNIIEEMSYKALDFNAYTDTFRKTKSSRVEYHNCLLAAHTALSVARATLPYDTHLQEMAHAAIDDAIKKIAMIKSGEKS